MLADVLVIALAVWQAVEAWHHGAIFAGRRAAVETWVTGLRGWLAELLLCPFCLSFWTGWILYGLYQSVWTSWFVYGLAAARLANLGNDYARDWCRTPNRSGASLPPLPPSEGEAAAHPPQDFMS